MNPRAPQQTDPGDRRALDWPANRALRILHLEDNALDAELVRRTLDAEELDAKVVCVSSQPGFVAALEGDPFDLILADYALPAFDGVTALALARKLKPEVPFIFVSGTIGEEVAIETLKGGATDYVLKHRLQRLGSSVRRALREARERSERKQAEQALRDSEELVSTVLSSLSAHIAVLDRTGQIIAVNAAWKRFARENGADDSLRTDVGRNYLQICRHAIGEAKEASLAQAGLEAVLSGASPEFVLEYPCHASSEFRWFVLFATPLSGQRGGAVVSHVDITARKRFEETILEQAALLDLAQDAIIVRNLEDRIQFWNKGAERLYGWSASETSGRAINHRLFGDTASLQKARTAVLDKGEWQGELHRLTKNGRTVIVNSRWTLLRDPQENPKSILLIDTDMTEKKKFELQFLRTQRMESIGRLASGIAHDLNNILTPILISVPMLRWGLPAEESEKMLTTIEASAQRGAEVVKQLLTYGRGVEGERAAVQVKGLITEMAKIARETFPKNIAFSSSAPKDLWPVMGDATQFHQVLMNLCVNARDAMPAGGRLTITAENLHVDEKHASMNADATVAPHVLICVTDTGQGISQDISEKIFDPFFTTKDLGQGSGLGLSTVLGIVKSHAGFLNVRSEPDNGSTFEIYLPAAPEAQMPEVSAARRTVPRGQGQTILVVDDEASICDVTKKILERNGYQVLTASDGMEAVTCYAQHRGQIDLVLTDIMMPQMDGVVLVRALKRLDPHVNVVASSGMTNGGDQGEKISELGGLGVTTFLSKPYTAEKMLQTFHDLLKKPPVPRAVLGKNGQADPFNGEHKPNPDGEGG